MATLIINMPDEVFDRWLSGYAYQHGYKDEVPGIGAQGRDTLIQNPEPKLDFVNRMIALSLVNSAVNYEVRVAEEVTRISKVSEVKEALSELEVKLEVK